MGHVYSDEKSKGALRAEVDDEADDEVEVEVDGEVKGSGWEFRLYPHPQLHSQELLKTNIRAPIPQLKSGGIPHDSLIPCLYHFKYHPVPIALTYIHARLPKITKTRNAFLVHKGFDVVERADTGAGTFFAKKTPWIKWSPREEARREGWSTEPTLSDEDDDWGEDDDWEKYDWEQGEE
ncbi:hypothetical protein IAR50_003254 [Cryptococcus sp. DSM 104548]